ncbi:IgA-specific serine endopeptidase [Wickerhamomyces ciferrii]|uniref:IgA-specific serine endopeptidase n=1 Tax=Wickerhamomyces ciferrii (strain ATCC 14091 / BCRC 22168 / CBS 111 / JCM 3599 / NBRC 0793 / NRRL Y-1031 F-60-10) TaxID=1206466 RepID=K0KRF2_WICCF|nr:IgA-specific serine endopeptidase [Wickerhamomyces ciferrii]CCH43859.1 IgA-specific serine endopeptidase [Wickerhamomyces ciferrii]
MSTNVNVKEIETLKALLREQKAYVAANNEGINKRINDLFERQNAKFNQLNSVVDLLIKENQEMKGLISNQRFVIQPVNPFNLNQGGGNQNNAQNNGNQMMNGNSSHQAVNPFQDPSFIAASTHSANGSTSSNSHVTADPQQQVVQAQQAQAQAQSQAAQQQAQVQAQQQAQAQAQAQAHAHAQQQAQQQAHHHQQQQQQQHHHHHSHHGHHQHISQQSPTQHSTPHQAVAHPPPVNQPGPSAHTPVLDPALTDQNANGSMIRFINNQYVDDSEAQLNANNNNQPGSNSSRIDFVFMDPSSNRRGQYRVHSNSITPTTGEPNSSVARPEDTSISSANTDTSITIPSASRLQRSNNRASEFDAENYDLIIHNDFNRVEDVYYEYYNSLKPQVEKVSKAYKVKKIRKYQKIKALAVRIDRYRKLKNCSLEESFDYFEDLRLGSDNRKKTVAWLYNSLPEVLRKVGLEDQLKKSGGAS